jgi:hypothetical protein
MNDLQRQHGLRSHGARLTSKQSPPNRNNDHKNWLETQLLVGIESSPNSIKTQRNLSAPMLQTNGSELTLRRTSENGY